MGLCLGSITPRLCHAPVCWAHRGNKPISVFRLDYRTSRATGTSAFARPGCRPSCGSAISQLIRVSIDEDAPGETGDLVERLMGKKPELRFQYIQENARFVEELDV